MTASRPVAVITGGTHGIGRHAADVLASDGWSVAVCSRRPDEAAAVAAELEATHGGPAFGAGADVGSASETRAFAAAVAEQLGPPHAVVANAGVLGPVGPLHVVDLDEWAAAVAVDLLGVANTLAAFGAHLIASGRGSMVTMSGGGVGGPRMSSAISAYTSSKAAVVALTETVARELEPHGVRLNAVAPGAIATGFMDDVLALGPSVAGAELFEQTTRQRQQPDSLDDFDAVLRFLVDPAAPWITGRVLSARWDDLAELSSSPPPAGSSRYRLRRIDGALYDELAVGA